MEEILPIALGALLAASVLYNIKQARQSGMVPTLRAQLEENKAQQEAVHAEIKDLERSLAEHIRQLELSQQNERHMKRQMEEWKQDQEAQRQQFENLANRIFEEKTVKFKKDSEEGLAQMLTPLRERILEFQKKVEESFGQQAKEQYSLKNEIQRIVLANEKITLQAENLTKALKGESKTQGNWGEVMLEKILEDSGLRKGTDYISQGVSLDLRSEEGGRQMPDVIVMLPEQKHIIIDSKVSLTHYERYFSEADEDARAVLIKQFLASVKAHVTGLEQRRYQDTDKLGTPDFVLMFIPVEGAFMLALQQDASLYSYAWDKGVGIVCPSTLFISLRTIANLWRIETQNRNTLEIVRQGGGLYDKFVGFVEELHEVGKRLDKTKEAYDGALGKLSAGKGNLISRVEKLRSLGVKASKSMPEKFIEEEAHEEELLTRPEKELAG